jgi:hypothetical protein
MVCRPGFPPPEWMLAFLAVSHLFFREWTFEVLLSAVRTHAPTKRQGDPFADRVKSFVEKTPKSTHDEKRRLFVCLALVLSVRSELLLEFFWYRGTAVDYDMVSAVYRYLADNGSPFPGLARDRSRQAHTSEQKLWSIGFLLDAFVFPYLVDPRCFDAHLNLDAQDFVRSVAGMKLLKGALLMPHVSEYLVHAGLMKEVPEPEDPHDARNS